MTQYIDKDAVVAEIDERIASLESIGSENYLHDNCPEQYAMLVTLKSLKFSIDTLEVKEVDLEKEIKNKIDEYWYDSDYGAIQRHGGTITMEVSDVKEIAKHFFELGMAVSNKARKGE